MEQTFLSSLLMLNAGYASHDGDWNFSGVSSPFTRLYLVESGRAAVSHVGGTLELEPGHIYIVPAFACHSNHCEGEFEHFYIHLYESPGATMTLTDTFEVPAGLPATALDRDLFRFICSRHTATALEYADPHVYDNMRSLIACAQRYKALPLADRMEVSGCIAMLLSRFMRETAVAAPVADRRIRRAMDYMNSHTSAGVPVERLADEACLSRDHFIKIFRRETGCTPGQYMIARIMKKARLMLATETMPVRDIATSLGYEDSSYFVRLFHKHTSMTPMQYRNSFN